MPSVCIFSFNCYIHQKIFLLYKCIKILSRLGIKIYCRKIIINKPDLLKIKGPVLLACNHPNSFLDSVLLDTLFSEPVWSLARGDAFKKPFYVKLLTALKILPVYRTSEGTENLGENYKTFDACIDIFKKNGIVTIFSEGRCINEWHLRPLKKGTARLAFKAWEENIPLKILPVGINYNSFRSFGKNIFLNFGEFIMKDDFNFVNADGLRHQSFNVKLQEQLEQLVFEIPQDDKERKKNLLKINIGIFTKILLFIPALLGFITHAPLYIPAKFFTVNKTKSTDHHDSVILSILLFSYIFYLLIITFVLWMITGSWWIFLLLIAMPFTAWSYVQLKSQFDK